MRLMHTCYRIGDIDRSVAFYEKLGFEEVRRSPTRDGATNVFLGVRGDRARLELTHNPGVTSYELGTGYGHVALAVQDMSAFLGQLAEHDIQPEKEPYDAGGAMICFVRDPDGYRIELIETPDDDPWDDF